MWGTRYISRSHIRGDRFIPTHVGNTRGRRLTIFLTSVHPHACGEHAAALDAVDLDIGSSPRMWGTRLTLFNIAKYMRFIPTQVGNTIILSKPFHFNTVHPHACGEHVLISPATSREYGSSPRMWGTPDIASPRRCPGRFIPTHVGNTWSKLSILSKLSVHPHACGEHDERCININIIFGSSPRMWGTHPGTRTAQSPLRFIPTHVGNTLPQ